MVQLIVASLGRVTLILLAKKWVYPIFKAGLVWWSNLIMHLSWFSYIFFISGTLYTVLDKIILMLWIMWVMTFILHLVLVFTFLPNELQLWSLTFLFLSMIIYSLILHLLFHLSMVCFSPPFSNLGSFSIEKICSICGHIIFMGGFLNFMDDSQREIY